ncbi:hypothetical protein [Nonomuraea salmonea]|uniref:hypothetical protein n=1 Tax=Nonomuraea salmonea TaxID=46181 RepID=UPI0031E67CA7
MPHWTTSAQLASPPRSRTATTGPSVRNSPAMKCHTPWPTTHATNHGRLLISRHPSTSSRPNPGPPRRQLPPDRERPADTPELRRQDRRPDTTRLRRQDRRPDTAERQCRAREHHSRDPPAAHPGPATTVIVPAIAGAATADRLVTTPIRAFTRNRSGPGTTATTSRGTAGLPNAIATPPPPPTTGRDRPPDRHRAAVPRR